MTQLVRQTWRSYVRRYCTKLQQCKQRFAHAEETTSQVQTVLWQERLNTTQTYRWRASLCKTTSTRLHCRGQQTLRRYSELLLHTTGPFNVIRVEGQVITIDEDDMLRPISIEKATPVPRKAHVTKRIVPTIDQSVSTTVAHSTDKERNARDLRRT